MMDVMRHELVVHGKVQGVFFRKYTSAKARELRLTGYVMNLPDGRVLVEAEGSALALDALLEWCRAGPPRARVDEVKVNKVAVQSSSSFEVRY